MVEIARDLMYSSPVPGPDTSWKPAWPYIYFYLSAWPATNGIGDQVHDAKLGIYPQEVRNFSHILMNPKRLDPLGEWLRFLLFDRPSERLTVLFLPELVDGDIEKDTQGLAHLLQVIELTA